MARGHWKVVDKTYPKPITILVDGKETQGSKDAMEKWEAVDRKAWTDIVSVCTQADATHYTDETAAELWDRLENMKKPKGKTYYPSQLRAFVNYRQGPKETAEQVYSALKKIQAEITVLNAKTPIYDDMLQEIFLGALKEDPYGPVVFRINSEVSDPQIETVL